MPTSAPNNPPRSSNGQIGGGVFNPLRGTSSSSFLGGAGFNPLAAGNKQYGLAAGGAPNVGPVRNKGGYAARDLRHQAQQNAFDQISKGLR